MSFLIMVQSYLTAEEWLLYAVFMHTAVRNSFLYLFYFDVLSYVSSLQICVQPEESDPASCDPTPLESSSAPTGFTHSLMFVGKDFQRSSFWHSNVIFFSPNMGSNCFWCCSRFFNQCFCSLLPQNQHILNTWWETFWISRKLFYLHDSHIYTMLHHEAETSLSVSFQVVSVTDAH